MGYTTTFAGEFKITPALRPDDLTFLRKLARTRRMKRDLDPEFGTEGEFYVDGGGDWGQADEPNVTDSNKPPSTQPSLWLHWTPNDDGTLLSWDGGEKFYGYAEWLKYLLDKVLTPRGYELDGEVAWEGEESDDRGLLTVKKGRVTVRKAVAVEYGPDQEVR